MQSSEHVSKSTSTVISEQAITRVIRIWRRDTGSKGAWSETDKKVVAQGLFGTRGRMDQVILVYENLGSEQKEAHPVAVIELALDLEGLEFVEFLMGRQSQRKL